MSTSRSIERLSPYLSRQVSRSQKDEARKVIPPHIPFKLWAPTAERESVPTLLSLEYPNGRTHLTEVAEELKPGAEFDLYGRRWKAVHRIPPRGRSQYAKLPEPKLLCRQAD